MCDDYDNGYGMSDDDLLYREMNPEDPWYMGPQPANDDNYDEDDED